eukprot:10512296-Prorocentrum_lima.AAC.1
MLHKARVARHLSHSPSLLHLPLLFTTANTIAPPRCPPVPAKARMVSLSLDRTGSPPPTEDTQNTSHSYAAHASPAAKHDSMVLGTALDWSLSDGIRVFGPPLRSAPTGRLLPTRGCAP